MFVAPTRESTATLVELISSRQAGYAMPSPFYTSDDVFSTDLQAIFGRQWLFAASVAELPEPGDYVTIDIGPSSVILVRDDARELRAFHNVCRHRGSRIVSEPRGAVGNLVCPYHKWTYALDGRLRHVASPPANFDATCFSLRSVALREVSGLLYVSLAADPPSDFNEVAATIAPYVEPHDLRRTKVAAQVDIVEQGNWKLTMENNRECYHCDGHPELACSLFPTYGYDAETVPALLRPAWNRYLEAERVLADNCERNGLEYRLVEQLFEREAGFRIQREALDGAGQSFSTTGELLCRRLMGDLTEPRLGRLTLHHQPNAWFHFLSDHAITFSVLPLTPDSSLLRTTWLVHEDAVEGADYDVESLTDVWRQTNLQDAEFVASTQRGVSNPSYIPGPFTPGEYQVDAFCKWYTDRLVEWERR